MRNGLKRWKVALRNALFVASVAVAPGAGATAQASEPLVLSFWTTDADPKRLAAIRNLMDGFVASNDGIEVDLRSVGNAELLEAFDEARSAGAPPDIVHAGSDSIVALGLRGDLDRNRTTRLVNNIRERRFAGGARRMLRGADGLYYGVPIHGWLQGLIYRADWFAEAGLEPPNSWDRILEAAQRLHDPENGRYGILVGTKADIYAQQVFSHLALTNGVEITDAKGAVVFDSPRTVETLTFLKQLADYTPPGPQTWRGRDYYLQGRLAMMFYSTYIMDDLAIEDVAQDSLTGDNFDDLEGAAYDPALIKNTRGSMVLWNTRSAGYGAVIALGMTKTDDPVRQAAQEALLRFLFRNDVYVAWMHIEPGGNLPVLTETAQNPRFYRDLRGVLAQFGRDRTQAIIDGMADIESFDVVNGVLRPQAALVLDKQIIGEMIRRTIRDDVPPAEAVSWAAEEMRALLEQTGLQ